MLKAASSNNINELVGIHKRAFHNLFSSKLGDGYLRLFYKSVVTSKFCKCFVCLENNKVVGYVAGTINKNKLFNHKNEISAICYIFKNLFLLNVSLFEVFIFIRYLLWANRFNIKSELLAFAVDEDYQMKGVGGSLLENLIDYYKKNNIDRFIVFSDDKISKAIGFYNKRGFEPVGSIQQPGYKVFCLSYRIKR